MSWTRTRVVLAVLALSMGFQVTAQTSSEQRDSVSLTQVRQLRAATERDPALTEELRAKILELYDGALTSLAKTADNLAAADQFERDRRGIDRNVASLRLELKKPQPVPRLPLSSEPTVAEAEDALTRERAKLAANWAALRQQERVAEDRTKSRSDTSQRLGELDLEFELLNDELRRQASSTARTKLKDSVRLSILARRQAVLSEIDVFRSRLALLNDRSSLVPLETDLLQRRVDSSQLLVTMLEQATHDLRLESSRQALMKIRQLSHRLAGQVPSLSPLATETEELAQVLWAPDGIVASSENTIKALDTIRYHQAQLNRVAELTSRKFEAYGHRGSVTRWWPGIPDDFPEPGFIADTIRVLDEDIPEVDHRLIIYEQKRSDAHNLNQEVMLLLQNEFGDQLDPALATQVRDLLTVRQDLLDELVQRLGRYSDQLVEYLVASNKFLAQVEEVERFLYSHILWSRSVPKPIIPRPRDMIEAAAWLTPDQHLKGASLTGAKIGGQVIFAGLLLALLVLLRQPIRSRLKTIATRVAKLEQDSLGLTIRALLWTVLLASPLPMAFYCAGALANLVGGSIYWRAMTEACFELVMVAALFELVRQVFAPYGLAEAHFTWPTYATRPLYRGLMVTEAIGLPILYVALHLAFAGMRLDSPDKLQLYNNSLGRVAFIVAMFVFGLSILTMLRPEKKDIPNDQDMRVPWPERFAGYAFPTAFLGAYPIIILATFIPAILAVFGFYVTGVLLAYQMVRTLLLGLAVLVGGGLVHRWRIVNRNRALLKTGGEPDEAQEQQFLTAENQAKKLYRFAIIAALAIGLFSIWSEALPMLQLLKRIQILPRVQVLEPVDTATIALGVKSTATDVPAEDATQSKTTAVAPGMPGLPDTGAATTQEPSESTPLTLWNLIESILAGLITLVLVRNLPGVIEILLQRRTTLDGGARFAFSTLVRYSITIIGTIIVFGLLGITWDKVQWLAAALTFGLGFGLQEIVANFVSGLILLIERPVRVGDVVTIGTLMGKVNRIQIRATTITLWDRSEMIVPNKEFITTKLVNWTLSDSKRRIEIPVRIAFGADLQQVKNILIEAAEQYPAVLEDPAPHALLLGFGDDSVQLELRFVVDFGQGLAAKDAVQMTIDHAFKEQGIEFALPKSEVRFVSETGEIPDPDDT